MSLTPEQIEERRTMITASDVSAIVALNPYRGPLDVWLEKRGLAPPEEMDPARADRIEWGHLLEPHLRRRYAERHGVVVTAEYTKRHPTKRHHGATPDGLVYTPGGSTPLRGWEGKSHSVGVRHLYGPPGTDEVPIHELMQCQWLMHVTDVGRWDLTAFLDGAERDYVIERDQELIDELVARVDPWWQRHVIGGEQPAVTDADADALLKLYPRHTRDELVPADQAARLAAENLRAAIAEHAHTESRLELAKNAVKAIIGDASGLDLGQAGKITWRLSKDSHSTVTDWAGWRTAVQLAASAPVLRSAVAVLESLAAVDVRSFEGGPDRFDGLELAKAIRAVSAAAQSTPATSSQVTKAGSRRFCTPRSWKRPGEAGDAD